VLTAWTNAVADAPWPGEAAALWVAVDDQAPWEAGDVALISIAVLA
jgi:hypothetical protein